MPAGREEKDTVRGTGREEGRKVQVSQNYPVTAGLEINLSQTAWQIYTTLGLTPGDWKVGVSFSECHFISMWVQVKNSTLKKFNDTIFSRET